MEKVRRATWNDVVNLCRLLHKHNVNYILVGGYALCADGFSRATYDIDVAVDPSLENSKKWVLALSELPDEAAKELAEVYDPFAERAEVKH